MIFTEKEVLESNPLCPAASLTVPCRASKCMAWRWYSTKGGHFEMKGDLKTDKGVVFSSTPGEKTGYCGLAGSPEQQGEEG